MLVVHDLLPDVDRGAVDLQGPLDGDDRAVHAGAVPPGIGQEDTSALISHAPMVCRPAAASPCRRGGTGHGPRGGGSGHTWCHAEWLWGTLCAMAREIPEVVRAAAGLAATVLDEARKLPETLPGLPVRLIGLAMQQAMKVQQQYAGLVARGDELFTGLRGEDEPGLATFDDDLDEPAASNGFRESAFDRAESPAPVDDTVADAEVPSLPRDPAADAVTSVVDQLADQVEAGQQSIEELVEEAPAIEEILDEIAIDELVDQAPTLDETAPATDTDETADVSTTVDVLTADGDVTTVDAAVTDEGVAAAAREPPPRPPPTATEAATATDEGGSPVAAATGTADDAPASDTGNGSTAPATAPIDGYDDFSIAQLRGRLRGYQLSTVEELISYEQASRAREPYLRDAPQPPGEAGAAGGGDQPPGTSRRLKLPRGRSDPHGSLGA